MLHKYNTVDLHEYKYSRMHQEFTLRADYPLTRFWLGLVKSLGVVDFPGTDLFYLFCKHPLLLESVV